MREEIANFFARLRRRGAPSATIAVEIDEHPLAHLSAIYKPQNISYFTHRGRYRPLALTIETTNICNNDCVATASVLHRFRDDELGAPVALLDRLAVSIYGFDADEYATMTRKRHYDRMVDGIVRLLAFGGPEFLPALEAAAQSPSLHRRQMS